MFSLTFSIVSGSPSRWATCSTNARCCSSGSNCTQLPSVIVSRKETGSGGGEHEGLQPASRLAETAARQPLLGFRWSREVPVGSEGGQVILPSWLPGDGIRRLDDALHSPGAATLRDQPATWAQECGQPSKQFVVVKDPVERRGREDDIDRLGQAQVEQTPIR